MLSIEVVAQGQPTIRISDCATTVSGALDVLKRAIRVRIYSSESDLNLHASRELKMDCELGVLIDFRLDDFRFER